MPLYSPQIVLLGPMCIGKTTIAQLLSKKLQKIVVALDEEYLSLPREKVWQLGGSSIEVPEKLHRDFENGTFSKDPSENFCLYQEKVNGFYEPCIAAKFLYLAEQYPNSIIDAGSNLYLQSNSGVAQKLLSRFGAQSLPMVLSYSDDPQETYTELYRRFIESRSDWNEGGLYSRYWQHFVRDTIEAPLLEEIGQKGPKIYTKGLSLDQTVTEILRSLGR